MDSGGINKQNIIYVGMFRIIFHPFCVFSCYFYICSYFVGCIVLTLLVLFIALYYFSSGGLDQEVDDKVLHSAFIPFGEIANVVVPNDIGKKHRGFGFVEFEDPVRVCNHVYRL